MGMEKQKHLITPFSWLASMLLLCSVVELHPKEACLAVVAAPSCYKNHIRQWPW